MIRTRFAPSPTGLLHVGNAYSALMCELWARQNNAELLLRIEDIDFTRCRKELSQQMLEDLAWLDIRFDGETVYQQQRLTLYQQALEKLLQLGVLYPCFCTRKEIQQDIQALATQQQFDVYPGTCKRLTREQKEHKLLSKEFCWRLDHKAVAQQLGDSLFWTDSSGAPHKFTVRSIGDVIIGRKDIHYSYHLSVVVDDATQAISHVVRGEDLRSSTPIHRVLQQLLGYEPPLYLHHRLIKDAQGERLAKTRKSVTLKSLRESGMTALELREMLLKKGCEQPF